MKANKLLLTTTSCVLGLGMMTSSAIAYADYPTQEHFMQELTITSFNDYAVNDNQFVFADGILLHIFEQAGAEQTAEGIDYQGNLHTYTSDIGVIEATAFVEDNLYVQVNHKTYLYGEQGLTESEKEVSFSYTQSYMMNDLQYTLANTGALRSISLLDWTVTDLGSGFSKLSQEGESLYAVKESTLYAIANNEAKPLHFHYVDTSITNNIAVDTTKTALLNTSTTPTFIQLKEVGDYYTTKIDIEKLNGTYFESQGTLLATRGKRALKLCEVGNATIYADSSGTYITATSNVIVIESTPYITTTPLTGGNVLTATHLYSTPYSASTTVIADLAMGDSVTILSKISGEVLQKANGKSLSFYCVRLQDGTTGYVLSNFITEFTFSENEQITSSVTPTYDDLLMTVGLSLALVALVLLMIGYLVFSATKSKKNKKKKIVRDEFEE